jgi:hypothetical protein
MVFEIGPSAIPHRSNRQYKKGGTDHAYKQQSPMETERVSETCLFITDMAGCPRFYYI